MEVDDEALEIRLLQLVQADILAQGSSSFHFRGLGDRVFAMVFRRLYGAELEEMSPQAIEDELKSQLASVRGKAAHYKGEAAEYRVLYRLFIASQNGATLADVVTEGAEDGVALGPFASLRKARFYLDQKKSYEIDIHAISAEKDGTDLRIEVKDWERPVSVDEVRRFLEAKEKLSARLARKSVFLFYSESGFSQEAEAALAEGGVLILDPEKLARYEAPPPWPSP